MTQRLIYRLNWHLAESGTTTQLRDSCSTEPWNKWAFDSCSNTKLEMVNWERNCHNNDGCLKCLHPQLWGKTIISSGWTRAVFFPHSPVPGSHSSRSSSSLGHSADATKISSEFCGWKEKCVVLEQNERAHLNVVTLFFSFPERLLAVCLWFDENCSPVITPVS